MSEQTQTNLDFATNTMTERSQSPEVALIASPFEVVKGLASEAGKEAYLAHINELLYEDPILSHINMALETSEARSSEINNSWKEGIPTAEQQAENGRKEAFNKRIQRRLYSVYGYDAVDQCRNLRRDKYELGKPYIDFFASGQEGDKIFKDILGRAVNQDKDVRSIFVPEEPLVLANGPSVTIMTSAETVTEIPIGMFVSAIGFDSWNGRPRHISKDGKSSKSVIEDYAARETDPPAVEDLIGLALPDGRLVFVSGNSHRVAAQLRHPDRETIPFSGVVTIKALNTIPYRLRTNSAIAS